MNDMTPPRSTSAAPAPAEQGVTDWFRAEVDRLFEEMGRPGRSLLSLVPRLVVPKPAIELTDAGDAYHLSAELPGLTAKDVTVELAGGMLMIAAEKHETAERRAEDCLINERPHGHFQRQIALPADADDEKVQATFKHGLLTLEIGKNSEAGKRVRKIKIEG